MSTIKLKGSSSGEAEVTVAAAAGTPTFTLPTTVGSANQLLKNSGTAGTLEYASGLISAGTSLGVNTTPNRHFHLHDTSANTQVLMQVSNATTGTANGDGFHIGINSSQAALIQNKEDTNLTIFTGGETSINCVNDGAVELYHDDTKQCETSANGLAFPSGKGIDFAATGGPTGTGSSGTSELLADYEEGTWDPAPKEGSFSYESGKYTKIGRMVFVTYEVTFAATSGSSHQNIGALPYAAAQDSGVAQGYHNYGSSFITHLAGSAIWFYAEGGAAITESNTAGKNFRGTAVYYVA